MLWIVASIALVNISNRNRVASDFLNLLGWAWLSAALGGWTLAALRFMFPTVLYEPNPIFKAGFPTDFPLDGGKSAVSDKWQKEFRTWIVTTAAGIYAFQAKCTHLGCTPRWEVNDQRFKCPCHGSNFNIDGEVVAGPAPEPLRRCAVSLASDGQLVVNRAIISNNPSDIATDKYFLKKEKYA